MACTGSLTHPPLCCSCCGGDGGGAHAQVWKARRTGSLQTVAVKLITKHGKNDKDVRSLRQEIEILRTLQHPNIIAMLDAFETKTDFCVVTEFAQGACVWVGLWRWQPGGGRGVHSPASGLILAFLRPSPRLGHAG